MSPFCSDGRGGLHLTNMDDEERVHAPMSSGGPVGSVMGQKIGERNGV